MRVADLAVYAVRIPLKREIKHASAARRESVNVVVRCRLADGTSGWGEGVPRLYVTGETPEGAVEQFAATSWAQQLDLACASWPEVVALCDRLQPAVDRPNPRGSYGNALRAAVELSLLDAFGKHFGEPASCLVQHVPESAPLHAPRKRVRYSSAITAETPGRERWSALKMRLYGFSQVKLKVAMPGVDDVARLRTLRRWLGSSMDVRIDANEGWHADELRGKLEPLSSFGITAVEQPIPHEEVAALADFRRQVPLPVMLDESLTSEIDAHAAIRDGTCDLFNIRLSKCGGFVPSLRLAALAAEHGLGYQLGCHPGESGILSAAGRHFAAAVRDIRYLEGSYDRHLLKERFTREDFTFGFGGWAPALAGPGWGVTIDEQRLRHFVVGEASVAL